MVIKKKIRRGVLGKKWKRGPDLGSKEKRNGGKRWGEQKVGQSTTKKKTGEIPRLQNLGYLGRAHMYVMSIMERQQTKARKKRNCQLNQEGIEKERLQTLKKLKKKRKNLNFG